MNDKIKLSKLGHTWLFDIDGTIVKHNGYLEQGYDTALPGALEFLQSIPEEDEIIFLTARSIEYKNITEKFLSDNNIKYKTVIYNLPYGERILINDKKPSGLNLSYGVNTDRDRFMDVKFVVDENL